MSRFAAATNAGALGAWKRRSRRRPLPWPLITPNQTNACCARARTQHAPGPACLVQLMKRVFLAFLGFYFELAAPRAAARQLAAARCARAGCRGRVRGCACGGPTGSRSKHRPGPGQALPAPFLLGAFFLGGRFCERPNAKLPSQLLRCAIGTGQALQKALAAGTMDLRSGPNCAAYFALPPATLN